MPLEDNIHLVGTCCLSCMGMKGRLSHQPTSELLPSFKQLGWQSRSCGFQGLRCSTEGKQGQGKKEFSVSSLRPVGRRTAPEIHLWAYPTFTGEDCWTCLPVFLWLAGLRLHPPRSGWAPVAPLQAASTWLSSGWSKTCSWEGVRWPRNLSQPLFSQHLLPWGKMTNCLLNYLRYYRLVMNY